MINHRIFLALFSVLFAIVNPSVRAQQIEPQHLQKLQAMDDSLGEYGARVLDEPLPKDRLTADSMFTRILVRALRVPYSFHYRFDSMQTAPVVYPDDSSFRIITWHYTLDDANYRQRGVVQINTPDGSLKMFPLYDFSDSTDAPEDSIRTSKNWIGAVYYRIIQKSWQGKPVYTVLGYDENNDRTTRKWMETLSFNHNGEPRFGGNFNVSAGKGKVRTQARYLLEYKKGSSAKLNFDPGEDLIIMDHLVSENNQPDNKATFVPGGDYEAFKWTNGNWVNDPKMFTQMLGDGNAPKEKTIFDDNGVADESKLMEQSEKNVNKKKTEKPQPAKPVKKQ